MADPATDPDYAAIAAQYGGKPANSTQGAEPDYASIAAQYGGRPANPSTSETTPTTASGFRGMVKAAQDRIDNNTAPDPNATGVMGAIQEFSKGTAAQVLQPFVHPAQTAIAMGKALMAGGGGAGHPLTAMTGNPTVDAQNEEARSGVQAETAQQGKQMGEQAKADPYYTAGNIVGAAAVTHGIARGLPEVPLVKAIRGNGVAEGIRTALQDKFSNGVPEKAIDKFGGQMADIRDEQQINAERGSHQQAIQDKSAELDKKYDSAEAAGTAANNKLWDVVHEKTGATTTPNSPIREAASAATQLDPAEAPIFKRLSEDPPPSPQIQDRDGVFRPGDPGYEDAYQDLYGTPPPLDTDNVNFGQVSRWYSYVQDKLYGPGARTMSQGTRQAYKVLRNALDNAQQDIATQSGATDELAAARKSHQQLKEAFSDSPSEPSTNKSKSLQELSPEAQKEQAQNQRIERIAAYDPTIHQTIAELKTHRQALDNLPNPGTTKEPVTPAIEQATRDEVAKNIKKYGSTGQWVARLVLGGGLKAVSKATGGMAGAFTGDLVMGQAGLMLMSKVLRSESALDWLAKPTAETMRQIESLPPQDAAKLKMGITALAQDELRRNPGKANTPINPSIAAWLGATPKRMTPKEIRDAIPKK